MKPVESVNLFSARLFLTVPSLGLTACRFRHLGQLYATTRRVALPLAVIKPTCHHADERVCHKRRVGTAVGEKRAAILAETRTVVLYI